MSASGFSAGSSKDKLSFIDKNCAGPQAKQLSLAVDGLTRNRLIEQTLGTLQPGYREDLLMVFLKPEFTVSLMRRHQKELSVEPMKSGRSLVLLKWRLAIKMLLMWLNT